MKIHDERKTHLRFIAFITLKDVNKTGNARWKVSMIRQLSEKRIQSHMKNNEQHFCDKDMMCIFYTTFNDFSMKYLVMCNVYTDIGGKNSFTMFVHLCA